MRFHFIKDGKPICNKVVDPRYLTDDWSMVDCTYCLSHKDKPSEDSVKRMSRSKYY